MQYASLFIVVNSSRSRYAAHCTMVQCGAFGHNNKLEAATQEWRGVVEYTPFILF